tara:strand:+ start:22 stop:240 length:219 start_codon:yes stop_codon:yes gene_type:complete
MIKMHTEFYNKILEPKPTINSAIAVLQKKFGRKTPISVFFSSDGKLEKIEIGKDLTTTEKKWISDKFPELST